MKNIAHVIGMGVIQQQDVDAAQRSNARIRGSIDSPSRSGENSDPGGILKEERAVPGTKFAIGGTERRDGNDAGLGG
jgi:hypothetical protein